MHETLIAKWRAKGAASEQELAVTDLAKSGVAMRVVYELCADELEAEEARLAPARAALVQAVRELEASVKRDPPGTMRLGLTGTVLDAARAYVASLEPK